jgi:Protein of unknown function (DUF3618).
MRVKWENEVERPWVGMTSESMTDIEHARAELVATLDAIKEKLNLPRQIRRRRDRAMRNLRELHSQHPPTFTMVLGGATVVIGVVFIVTIHASRRR